MSDSSREIIDELLGSIHERLNDMERAQNIKRRMEFFQRALEDIAVKSESGPPDKDPYGLGRFARNSLKSAPPWKD